MGKTGACLLHRSVVDRREMLARAEVRNRRHAVEDALDRFQSAIVALHGAEHSSQALCRRIGKARVELIAVIERNDQAERLSA